MIVVIDGGCVGVGLGWVLVCDFWFVMFEVCFVMVFFKVVVFGDMGVLWSLVCIVGGVWVCELLLFFEKIIGEEVFVFGLVMWFYVC